MLRHEVDVVGRRFSSGKSVLLDSKEATSCLRWFTRFTRELNERRHFAALSCEPVYGYQGDGKPEYIVLDGQQRLTAIYYAFLAPDAPLPNRSNRFFYFVNVDKFMAEQYDEAFGYEWFTRRWSKVLGNKEAQYESHLFPFHVIGATGWELPNWVQGYEGLGIYRGTTTHHSRRHREFAH
jgi:hypothetical protein